MVDLKIKNTPLPQRCDICHQTDLFDAEKNVCLRCSSIVLLDSPDEHNISLWQSIFTKPKINPEIEGVFPHSDFLARFLFGLFIALSCSALYIFLSDDLSGTILAWACLVVFFVIAVVSKKDQSRRYERFTWMLKNVKPKELKINISESSNDNQYEAELFEQDKSVESKKLNVNKPTWDITPLLNKTILVNVYFDPKYSDNILIKTQRGCIASISSLSKMD